jgi:methyltransferase (TIGR00027 family)
VGELALLPLTQDRRDDMAYERFDAGHPVFTLEVPWEEDRKSRTNPETLTSLLREQVPVLEFVQWKVTRVEPGLAESVLPLNPPSTNQHFTHQAALFLLAADYTGGIAVGSLLTGWPVVGVHPVCSDQSMSLWLLKGEVKYLRPSVADLTALAIVEPARHARIRRRFLDGRPVIETVNVQFRNADVKVAEATLTYFARQSEKLRCDGASPEKVNILYELKLTSSAELIAGVRARESGGLFDDPFAARMSGEHGMALASRFCQRSPQLGGMVAARTRHLDQAILDFLAAGGRDVVIVGVGWDMRPFRLHLPEGTRVYELDFPTTLKERRRRLTELTIRQPHGVCRIEVPIDLRTMSLAHALEQRLDFHQPVFVAWEGMSMYFREDEVRKILQGMMPVLDHPASRLWVDLVDRDAVLRPDAFAEEVQAFMRGMQILGEPFTFGADSVEEFMAGCGLACQEVVASDLFLNGRKDPVYSLYRFCLASSRSASLTAADAAPLAIRRDPSVPAPAQPHQTPLDGVLTVTLPPNFLPGQDAGAPAP